MENLIKTHYFLKRLANIKRLCTEIFIFIFIYLFCKRQAKNQLALGFQITDACSISKL